MRFLRHAVVSAAVLWTVLAPEASAQQTGPDPSDIIQPRHEAGAADAGRSEAMKDIVPHSGSGAVLTTVGYLLFFGLLIGGGVLLFKRGSLPKPFGKSEGKLRVLENRMLGNRQFLMVVEYEGAKMLLGVCPGRIDYLTPLAGHPLAEAEASIAAEEAGAADLGRNTRG
ncbi:MAG: hypothetical protein D6781_04730 [Verrucomicrobia bacterium]|nr:MAG: hypothetical protein D6781_04730 [Verrucomicrobiota bacterium]